ncbi:hypothetical protein [Salinibacter grassmerensis]|uniref:hypothetical protein n=1 Tax=Salinibacter grassmerensis TaxID=3040353 RepID=UPI0021E7CBBE|nr:hypothetical protein [Salinibacter grassmerensis]
MPRTSKLAELHGRCTVPPADLSLMARMDWEPSEDDVSAFMAELSRLMTSTQARLLHRTCSHFEDHWEWLPWADVDAGGARCIKGDVAPYILTRSGGRVVAAESGRWYYDWQTGGSVLEQVDRLRL